jgi:ankyrin repeat protein
MATTTNMKQSTLIQNFNAFAGEASNLLGMNKMSALDEKGCCYALALFDLQQAHIGEAATREFYHLYNLVTTQMTPSLMGDLVKQAKVTDQEKRELKQSGRAVPLYQDFIHEFPDGSKVSFEKLYQFMQTIGKLQSGFESVVSKNQKNKMKNTGKLEGVAANYENNHAFTCQRDELVGMLKRIRLSDNHYAIISTMGHAINFRKTHDGHYIVYDANHETEPKKLKTLQELGDAILEAVRKVQHFTQSGGVTISVKGASFGDGGLEFERSIRQYWQTLLFARPISGLSKACHDIVVNNRYKIDHLSAIAVEIYALYTSEHDSGKVNTMQEFVARLPPVLQSVAKEGLDYFRRAAFVDAVEGKGLIDYGSIGLNADQHTLLSRVNDTLLKYHEGELSRVDLASNIVGRLDDYGDLSAFPGPIHQRLQKLQIDLGTFMEGEVADASIINEMTQLNLNDRTQQGHSLASRLLAESPNKLTLQTTLEKAKALGESFTYDPNAFEDPKDGSANVFLTRGNLDAVAYFMENTDARSLFKNETINNIIIQGNMAVLNYLLTHSHDAIYSELQLPEQIIKNPNVMALAIKSQNLSLLSALMDKGVQLNSTAAKALLINASDEILMAIKKAQEADRTGAQAELRDQGKTPSLLTVEKYEEKFAQEYHSELREIEVARKMLDKIIEKGDEKSLDILFREAISKKQLDPARKIFLKDMDNSPEAIERQKQLLVLAAEKGDLETVKWLVENNPDVINAKDARGLSALSKACAGNYAEIANYLIGNGVNVKEDASSPLFYAAKSGNKDLCEILMDEGASLEQKASVEKLPPLAGVMLSNLDLKQKAELINVLFNEPPGATNISISKKQLPLAHEAVLAAAKSPKTTNQDIKMLCNKFNIDLDKSPHAEGKCLALHALEAENLTLARELLDKPGLSSQDLFTQGIQLFNITMKKINEQEKTLESWEGKEEKYNRAFHQELQGFLTYLIKDLKLPLESSSKEGKTPLMLAAQHNLTEFIKLFLEKGVRVDRHDQNGNTALHYAAETADLENIKLIAKSYPNNNSVANAAGQLPMHCLAQSSTTAEAIRYMVGENSPNAVDNNGSTILHAAVRNNKSLLAVREILRLGVEPLQKNGLANAKSRQSALDIVVHLRIESTEGHEKSKNAEGQYFGNVAAVLQATPAKALEKDRAMLNKLKKHKGALIDAYEMYLSHAKAHARTPEEKKAVIAELDRSIRGENGIGRLLKTKIRLKEFKIDNAFMTRLKAFRSHLVEGTVMKVEEPKGARYR